MGFDFVRVEHLLDAFELNNRLIHQRNLTRSTPSDADMSESTT